MNDPKVLRDRCKILLIAMLGKDLALKWWDSPNKAFDMKTPEEQWEQDYLTVYNYLMDHAYGR